MQLPVSKTNIHHPKLIANTSRSEARSRKLNTQRPLAWNPQPSGLTQDETRALVLEMIG